jgi:hypothetical protein
MDIKPMALELGGNAQKVTNIIAGSIGSTQNSSAALQTQHQLIHSTVCPSILLL